MNDAASLKGVDFIDIADVSRRQLESLLAGADLLKRALAGQIPHRLLESRSLALIFEKPSLRTRTTFQVGMTHLGGVCIDLGQEHMQMGVRESIADIGHNLERWIDAVMARVFEHDTLPQLADSCQAPIINGLSDRSHPCQALADLQTIRECFGVLDGLPIAYVGDGFNVANSLVETAPLTGIDLRLACPPGYEPLAEIVDAARAGGGNIQITASPKEAVAGAKVVYTDAWISMGLEAETDARRRVFAPYQVDPGLMAVADGDAVFMHCLPAHRGEEVTDSVLDGPQSVVFQQAENRLHAQKSLLVHLVRGESALAGLDVFTR